MTMKVDFTKQKTSWTKFDIVQVMEVIENPQTLQKYKTREALIDEPILKSFLGIKSLDDPLPDYWNQIQNYPKDEKKLFALFAVLFTHGEIIKDFAEKYSKGDMKGVFSIEEGKQYTNIRSALIESGAAKLFYRREKEVPFDFSPIIINPEVGKLFKQLLKERISRFTASELTDNKFYEICYENNFHKAISVSRNQFESWLERKADFINRYIEKVSIKNFFSIEEAQLDIGSAKEVYLLGENGDGKTLLLMAIYLAFNGYYITEKTNKEETGKAIDLLRKNNDLVLIGYDNKGTEYDSKKGIYLTNLFGYGVHRGRFSTDNSEKYGFMSLFDSEQTLKNPVSWLKDQQLLEFNKKNTTYELNDYSNSQLAFSVSKLKNMFFELLERNVEIRIEGSEVLFREKGTNLSFDQLSEGYKGVLIFLSDLIYRLNLNSNNDKKKTHLNGIVLVDEIDLHLHPKWQRVIVSKLRKLFPNIQFIFTTHSPTMVQGASEDSIIFKVYRNPEDGKTRVSDPYYRRELDHLMINTLVTSPLFGMTDSRMNSNDNNADTSDTYLIYRINKKLEEELIKQKAAGKQFITDDDIDELIQKIVDSELGNNDKN